MWLESSLDAPGSFGLQRKAQCGRTGDAEITGDLTPLMTLHLQSCPVRFHTFSFVRTRGQQVMMGMTQCGYTTNDHFVDFLPYIYVFVMTHSCFIPER